MANFPSRCQHLKINGTQCGSPALRRNRFCFFHKRFQDEATKLSAHRARRGAATFVLPVLEDANSIQIALMQVMRLLLSQRIDHKTASLLLYALQTASTNLRLTDFKPFRHDVILDVRNAADTPLGSAVWDDADFEDEQDEVETETDRAIQALKAERKKKESEAKWRRWAEEQYPDLSKPANPSAPLPGAASAAAGTDKVPPASSPKKPATGLNPEKVRQEISEMVRKRLLPAVSQPRGPTSG